MSQEQNTPRKGFSAEEVRPREARRIPLETEEFNRYSRHLTLSEVGVVGQEKLKGARVLCIGAGGLGSPIGIYLAAAGVGRVTVIDGDQIEVSNLNRQIAHATDRAGESKATSMAQRMREINPLVEVEVHTERLTRENAIERMRGHDLVVDGSDNFQTRYLVNDAAWFCGVPLVYGSIFRFEGQISLFDPHGGGPCYRCLYANPPPASLVPS